MYESLEDKYNTTMEKVKQASNTLKVKIEEHSNIAEIIAQDEEETHLEPQEIDGNGATLLDDNSDSLILQSIENENLYKNHYEADEAANKEDMMMDYYIKEEPESGSDFYPSSENDKNELNSNKMSNQETATLIVETDQDIKLEENDENMKSEIKILENTEMQTVILETVDENKPKPKENKRKRSKVTFEMLRQFMTGDEKYPFKCHVCDKYFGSQDSLRKHVHNREYFGDPLFRCEICSRNFTHKVHLNEHMRRHTGEKPYQCKECDKAFVTKSNLDKHCEVHLETKPQTCDICSKEFSCGSYLKDHLNRVHSKKYAVKQSVQCPECGLMYSSKHSLSSHIKITHMQIKPYICDVCSKKFATNAHLRSHMRSHSDVKEYTCDVCSQTFKYPGGLSRHQLIHKRKGCFDCELCPKSFITEDALALHVKRLHTSTKKHKCDICSESFKTMGLFNRHIRAHSKRLTLVCKTCSKSFPSETSLKTHMISHSNVKAYKCEKCPQAFKYRNGLRRHLRSHE